jgi:hypothetical protein
MTLGTVMRLRKSIFVRFVMRSSNRQLLLLAQLNSSENSKGKGWREVRFFSQGLPGGSGFA